MVVVVVVEGGGVNASAPKLGEVLTERTRALLIPCPSVPLRCSCGNKGALLGCFTGAPVIKPHLLHWRPALFAHTYVN